MTASERFHPFTGRRKAPARIPVLDTSVSSNSWSDRKPVTEEMGLMIIGQVEGRRAFLRIEMQVWEAEDLANRLKATAKASRSRMTAAEIEFTNAKLQERKRK